MHADFRLGTKRGTQPQHEKAGEETVDHFILSLKGIWRGRNSVTNAATSRSWLFARTDVREFARYFCDGFAVTFDPRSTGAAAGRKVEPHRRAVHAQDRLVVLRQLA